MGTRAGLDVAEMSVASAGIGILSIEVLYKN
jgi:hypothetical protein